MTRPQRRPTPGREADLGGRGRPRVSSRAVLEEAATELFLEQGYGGTTVDDIARRAGVSRGTFFNYFSGKADVFWGDVDAQLARLPALLRESPPHEPAGEAIGRAFTTLASAFGPDRVPWILTQFDAIGGPAEVRASALERFAEQARALQQFIAERDGIAPQGLEARTRAYRAIVEVLAAAQCWAEAGPGRGSLDAYVAEALG